MSDGSLTLWRAVLAALAADSTVKSLLGDPARVYDHVPEDTIFPYLVIGDGTAADDGTDTDDASSHRLVLHCWSRARGRAEARAVLDAACGVLHDASLTVSGQSLTYLFFDFSQVLRERDGRTHHGIMRFRARTEVSGS